MTNWLREKLRAWLCAEEERRLGDRLANVENHFVTRRDAGTGQVIETLAERTAAEDGRTPPPRLRGRNWNQMQRFLETKSAARAASQREAKRVGDRMQPTQASR